ncbi:arylsulfatase B-like isoform X1 [Branchiostoma floridae]|uniref:Arylsulfatase B-like isoform X1 n=1 Tax=Branchiostoma floridae TaxID=7739 RepID=A0A9J7KQP5_BRAFL|nr:arylsulfatase B-like isoform X1 [Branchiostoma floridae]
MVLRIGLMGRACWVLLHRRVGLFIVFCTVLLVLWQLSSLLTDVDSPRFVKSSRSDTVANKRKSKPHIVFILADDYGWNDIGYHGSFIQTPNLDRLASEGVKLENYYVQPICSPSREQLMTGRYQIHYGLQHSVITHDRPHGLPLDEVTLPQKLKDNGYSTHLVGKWHLGFFRREYLPLRRGFDTFYGFLTGGEDYWSHRRPNIYSTDASEYHGLDLRDQDKPVLDQNGTYSTHLFQRKAIDIIAHHDRNKPMFLYLSFQAVHAPLQVPDEYVEKYKDVQHILIKKYAAMVTAMDEAVGNVTDALKDSGLWDNTVLIFSTDNGARRSAGSNWPLRGWKNTLWEGGIRGVCFVTSNLLERKGTKSDALIHISDWFPTLIYLSHGSTHDTKPLDGFDVWDSISTGAKSPREEILLNIDPLKCKMGFTCASGGGNFNTLTYAAIRSRDWKLLTGFQDQGGWKHRKTSGNHFEKPTDSPNKHLWLFNIKNDPQERTDLSEKYPDVVQDLLMKLKTYNRTAVPPFWPPRDLRANPALHGDVFGPWL